MSPRLLTAAAVCLIAAPAFAQQPAPVASGRCTGLFCDLYYSNKPAPAPVVPGQPAPPDPTHLPCHDFLCAAFGGRTPDAPPPAPEPVAAPEPTKPVKAAKRKHRVRTVAAAEAAKPSGAEPAAAAR